MITDLLRHFGNPQNRLPPVIHIAGTNGKGSTCAFLYGALTAAGLRVHCFTSPHLCDVTERITVANVPISANILDAHLMQVYELTDRAISFFEAMTVIAFKLFAETPGDIALIEVGIGGLWDVTNLVSTTCASVITPISMDHQELLGPTYQDIALQKSGIMRNGIPCISGVQRLDVGYVITEHASAMGSPLFLAGEHWFFSTKENGVQVRYGPQEEGVFFPDIGLIGVHQRANAALAAMTLHVQKSVFVPISAIVHGFAHVRWPGRLQPLHGPGNQWFPAQHDLWIDGAHNEGGFEILAQHIKKEGWQDVVQQAKPLIIIVGMLPRKNPISFWVELAPLAHQVWVVESFGAHQGVSLAHMRALMSEKEGRQTHCAGPCSVQSIQSARAFPDLESVIAAACAVASSRFLVCGSLYLMGEMLKKNNARGTVGGDVAGDTPEDVSGDATDG